MKTLIFILSVLSLASIMVVLYVFGFQMADDFTKPLKYGANVFLVTTAFVNLCFTVFTIVNHIEGLTLVKK